MAFDHALIIKKMIDLEVYVNSIHHCGGVGCGWMAVVVRSSQRWSEVERSVGYLCSGHLKGAQSLMPLLKNLNF